MTTYTLNITQQDPVNNTQKNLSVTSDDAQDLMRLLMLSGIQIAPEPDTQPACAGMPQSTVMQLPVHIQEQQATYDYGHRDVTDEQDEFQITDYNFKGRADVPERLTSARFGSNALRNDMKESAYTALQEKYQAFLNEGRENEAGAESPLTRENRDEFEHDPQAGDAPITDGSRSPLSTIHRQEMPT
jgi:hypothetical protein